MSAVGKRLEFKNIKWPGNARIAVLINAEYEPTRPIPPLGPGVRDFMSMSRYEYEIRCGIGRTLGIMGKFEVPATFFVSGATAELYPESVHEIKRRGHEVAAHGWLGGEKWWELKEEEERKELARVVSAIKNATHEAPLGWLSPKANPSENTVKILADMNFAYHSDFFDDEVPYELEVGGKKIVEMPRTMATDDVGTLPIGSLFETYRDEFDYLYAESETAPKMFMTTWHIWSTPRPSRAKAMEDLLCHIKKHPGVWFARFIDVVECCRKSRLSAT